MAMTERLTLLIDASSKGAAQEFQTLSKSAEQTNTQVGLIGKSAAGIAGAMKGIGAAALGAGVVASVGKIVDIYIEGAKAAGAMAQSMNSTVGEASKFNSMMETVGLDANDLIEIQAEFAQAIEGTEDNIAGLNVAVSKNKDGTINWVNTLTDTLDALQGVSDATERNKILFELFGEEGGKQLSKLLTSGKSVKEIFETMPELFGAEDVQKALEFEAAMGKMKTAGKEFAVELGSVVVPMLTTVFDWLGKLSGMLDFLTPQLAGGLIGAGGIIAKLGDLGLAKTALGNFGLDIQNAFKNFQTGEITAKTAFGNIASSAKGTGGALLTAMGGPLGLTLAGLAVAIGIVADANAKAQKAARDHAEALAELGLEGDALDKAIRARAHAISEQSGMGTDFLTGMQERITGMFQGRVPWAPLQDEDAANAEAIREEYDKYIESLGKLGQVSIDAKDKQQALSDVMLDSKSTAQDFATALDEAVDAQLQKEDVDTRMKSAMEGVIKWTTEATTALLDLKVAFLDLAISQEDLKQKALEFAVAQGDPAKGPKERLVAEKELLVAVGETGKKAADVWVDAEGKAGRYYSETAIKQKQSQETLRVLQEMLATAPPGTPYATWLQSQIDTIKANNPQIDVPVVPTDPAAAGEQAVTGAQGGADSIGAVQLKISGSEGGPAVIEYITSIATRTYPSARITISGTTGGPEAIAYITSIATRSYPPARVPVTTKDGPAAIDYINSIATRNYGTVRIPIATTGGPDVISYIYSIVQKNYGTITIPVRYRAQNTPTTPDGPGRSVPAGFGVAGVPGAPMMVPVSSSSTSSCSGGVTNVTINMPAGVDGRDVEKAVRRYAARNGSRR